MKVLILGDINSIHIKRWSLSLINQNIELIIFSFQKPETNWCEENGITYYFIEIKKTKNFITKNISRLKYLQSPNKLRRIIEKHKPDIVHSHFLTSYGVLGDLSKFKPHIISVWGSDVYIDLESNRLKNRMLKALNNATLICSTSKAMAQKISAFENKIKIIPFGIDTQLFAPLEFKKTTTKIRIGPVKSLKHVYGIDILINVFAEIIKKNKNCELVIVGAGEELENYKTLVERLHLTDNVTFMSSVPNDKVPELLNSFDIFANLSRNESFGVSVIEASACELPIVASNIEGLKEVVVDSETGFLVDIENREEMVNCFQNLIENESLRHNLGKVGRMHVLNNFSIESSTQSQLLVYKESLK
jgi:glycosyltransferase involved in cell wall biosynthesis